MRRFLAFIYLVAVFSGCANPPGSQGNYDGGESDSGVDQGASDTGLPRDAAADADAVDFGAEPDAGEVDASDADSGSDAGEVDAAPLDAGSLDAASLDAAVSDLGVDAAAWDAGEADAGIVVADASVTIDAAEVDASPSDASASDAGASDAGASDAGGADAGVIACRSGERLCDGACSACPVSGVAETGCGGALCVAVSCESGYSPTSSACALGIARTYGAAPRSPLRIASAAMIGNSVAISHDRSTLIVTANEILPSASRGAAFVFAASGAYFGTLPIQVLDQTVSGYFYGSTNIALDERNQTAVVAERGTPISVFQSADVGYVTPPVQTFSASDSDYHSLGIGVAMSSDGHFLFVGDCNYGPGSDFTWVSGQPGIVDIYERGESGFSNIPVQSIRAPEYSTNFGTSVAVTRDGSVLLVGDDAWGHTSGVVHLFARLPSGEYSATPFQTLSGPTGSSLFGSSIAISESGDLLLIGDVDFGGAAAGAVHAYALEGSTFASVPYQTLTGPSESHDFGKSIAISADEQLLAIGDYSYGTDNRGAVLFFDEL